MKSLRRPLILLSFGQTVLLGACAEEPSSQTSEGPSESSGQVPDPSPFAECDRGTLEDDLSFVGEDGVPAPPMWIGPGVDPQTGELRLTPERSYVLSATYLALEPSDDAMAEFLSVQPALDMALRGNPGVVALQLSFSPQCMVARTFTVWEDEASMVAFVVSEAHLQAIEMFPRISRGGSTLASWSVQDATTVQLATAMERLSASEPYD